MIVGLLDLGSNTMKLAIYEITGAEFRTLYYDATYAYIISYVEHGVLSESGILKIIEVIRQYQPIAAVRGCDVLDCFSTASLRDIQNQQEVLARVKQETGVVIHPLTGDEEALYNTYSMCEVVKDTRFVGADLGGGSLQLFCREEGKELEYQSFPLGALKMYRQFVSGTFPTVNEMMAIKAYVLQTLECGSFKQGSRVLYQMGGTARMIADMLDSAGGFSVTELETAIAGMISNHTMTENTVAAINPARRLTLLPGMIIIYAVADYLQVSNIVYTQNSVREGYLLKNFMERNI